MEKQKNYFKILGVDESADDEQIRRAYKHLVLKHHPDRGTQADPERFLDVQEAYAVLCHPEKRKRYLKKLQRQRMRTIRPAHHHPHITINHPETIIIGDRSRYGSSTTFDTMLESLFNGGLDDVYGPSAPVLDVELTQEEADKGARIPFDAPVDIPCAHCGGSGGSWFYPCSTCAGKGILKAIRAIELDISPGIETDTSLTLDLGIGRGANRYLRIFIHVR
jgi:DnaJ-class molecular chaperone